MNTITLSPLDVVVILRSYAGRVPLNTLFIMDKDKTLVFTSSGGVPNTAQEQIVPKERVQTLRKLVNVWYDCLSPVAVVLASNQGGIERGFITVDEVHSLMLDVVRKCGNMIDGYAFCGHKIACHFRKPNPGMLYALYKNYMPQRVVFVGDSEDDEGAAENLKHLVSVPVTFIHERVFFNTNDFERLIC